VLLAQTLPEYHFRERHTRRVEAPPERVFAALRELAVDDSRVGHALFRLRGLGADPALPIFDEMGRFGFEVVAENAEEVVVAAIGQPWKWRGGRRPGDSDLRAFAEPGYAKIAMNFAYDGRTLSTETRVFLTDERSRRVFLRYWLLIRPFSGLIRRIWLRAIERRATA
jgi:hypothetical protein